jgi:PAS domain S-box-containing protein
MSLEVSIQNDQCFRALIEHSSDAFALLTPEGTVTYASPSSERVTGYPAEVLMGMNGFALVYPEDLENVRQQFTILLDRPGHFITVEYRICHKNGTWRWIEGTATNLLHDPAIQAIVVNFRDTTERKQAEEERHQLLVREQAARAEAEARAAELSAIFEAITDGVAIYDAKGAIHYANPAYRSLMGLEEDADSSLLQLDDRFEWLDMRDMEGRLLLREQLAVLRGERLSGTYAMDFLCRARKGEDIILNISGAPIHDAAGQIVGGVMVFRDVTGRRRLEQQLQYSELKLRSLVESNILGVAVSDSAGRIHEVNDRFAQLVGYSKEELLSGAVTKDQLIPGDYREALAKNEEILLSTGAMPPWEKECLRKDGCRVPTLMAGALIDRARGLALVLFHDISDRKEVERRKQEFLSMVSHELRTPLTCIMGLVELALLQIEQRPGSLAPEAEGLINQIEKMLKLASGQAEIETRLVEDLLEASRLEMHKFELSLQRENLVTIVQEVVANQRQVARTRQIELTLPPDEVVPVMGDAGRIGQVLTNYLTNALKYAPVDQVVSVRLEVVASIARVSVCDQGPGLTLEQQQHVWEHFYQAATPRHQGPDGGLGLGLAIAKAIVEQHQGQVGVESALGQGSTFWFTLQLADGLVQT